MLFYVTRRWQWFKDCYFKQQQCIQHHCMHTWTLMSLHVPDLCLHAHSIKCIAHDCCNLIGFIQFKVESKQSGPKILDLLSPCVHTFKRSHDGDESRNQSARPCILQYLWSRVFDPPSRCTLNPQCNHSILPILIQCTGGKPYYWLQHSLLHKSIIFLQLLHTSSMTVSYFNGQIHFGVMVTFYILYGYPKLRKYMCVCGISPLQNISSLRELIFGTCSA